MTTYEAAYLLLMRDAVPAWSARLPWFGRARRRRRSITLSTTKGLRPGDVLRLDKGARMELITVKWIQGRRVVLLLPLFRNHRPRSPVVLQQGYQMFP